jgi:hypothetical protein
MIKKVSHIGIAVNSIAEASKLYTMLGLKITESRPSPIKVKIAIIPVGDTRIELESTDPDGPSPTQPAQRGCTTSFQVDDIRASLEAMQKKEIPLIDKTPRIGRACSNSLLAPQGHQSAD